MNDMMKTVPQAMNLRQILDKPA